MIYHLALAEHLGAARAAGEYRWSTVGVTLEQEGFVHASYAEQVEGVAQRYYRDVADPLVLLVIDETLLPEPVRVENGFPHVYGPIPLAAVVEERAVGRRPDGVPDVAAALAGPSA